MSCPALQFSHGWPGRSDGTAPAAAWTIASSSATTNTRAREDDAFGLNLGGGFDVPVTDLVSLGLDLRYHNAFDALGGLQFITTMLNVGFHFGGQD